MASTLINLNADLGESFGAWTMGDDPALLKIVNSANIACGFHAGDPTVMQQTVRLAIAQGVSIGAHPSYPDLQGFGRRVMQMSNRDLQAMLLYQIGALQAIAAAEGGRVVVRSFAPGDGIAEDPVCGSGNGAAAAFRLAAGQVGPGDSYVASQGRQIGRDGYITIRFEGQDIHVGGQCVTCISGRVTL